MSQPWISPMIRRRTLQGKHGEHVSEAPQHTLLALRRFSHELEGRVQVLGAVETEGEQSSMSAPVLHGTCAHPKPPGDLFRREHRANLP